MISIVRTPHKLTALIAVRIEGTLSYTWVRVPDLSTANYPSKVRLLAAWARLGQVSVAAEQTLSDLLLVLSETVADPDSAQKLSPSPVEWNTAPAPPQATRAHPRAFKGTKYQPPKTRSPPQIDLRPHLCDARSLRVVASPLWEFLPAVRAQRSEAEFEDSAVNAVLAECGPGTPRGVPWNLPTPYVRYLWRSARAETARDQSKLLSQYHSLEMGSDPNLLSAFAHLAASTSVELAFGWGAVIHPLPPKRRATFLEILIEAGAFLAPPIPNAAADLEQTSALASDENFVEWAAKLLLVMRRDASTEYLLAGFRLATHFRSRISSPEVGRCLDFPEQDVEEIGISLDEHRYLSVALWEGSGRLPGFGSLIRQSHWRSFTPAAARAYFIVLASIVHTGISERALQEKWPVVAERPLRPR